MKRPNPLPAVSSPPAPPTRFRRGGRFLRPRPLAGAAIAAQGASLVLAELLAGGAGWFGA